MSKPTAIHWVVVWFMLLGMTPVLCFAQANRPLEVAPAGEPAAASVDASETRALYDKARDIAKKASSRMDTPASAKLQTGETSTPVEPARASKSMEASEAVGLSAGASTAPPVVVVSPNESKPLGPASVQGQPGDQLTDGTASRGWGVTQTLLSLGLVVVLILVARQLLLRWMGRPAAVNRSRVVETLLRVSVGPRQHVLLLRIGPRILVVADSAGQMRSLGHIDEAEEVASILKSVSESRPTGISQTFGQMLGRFDQEYDEDDPSRLRFEGRDVAEVQTDRARDQLSGLLSRVRAMASGGKGGNDTSRAQKTDRGTA